MKIPSKIADTKQKEKDTTVNLREMVLSYSQVNVYTRGPQPQVCVSVVGRRSFVTWP